MRKIILVCGLISGLILCAIMIATTMACYSSGDFEGGMVLGYTVMILAFSLIFVGIRNYRDKYNNGVITFGKAFKIGLYIALIASTMYVAVWLVEYYLFIPDFMEKYSAHMLKNVHAEKMSQAEMQAKLAEIAQFKEMYKNPLLVILLTYAEILPVGLIVSLICALILKRRANNKEMVLSH